MATMQGIETINGKNLAELTHAEWTAIEAKRDAGRLIEQVQREIDRCRRRLDEAERDLNRVEYAFGYSSGILSQAASDLDMAAARYSLARLG